MLLIMYRINVKVFGSVKVNIHHSSLIRHLWSVDFHTLNSKNTSVPFWVLGSVKASLDASFFSYGNFYLFQKLLFWKTYVYFAIAFIYEFNGEWDSLLLHPSYIYGLLTFTWKIHQLTILIKLPLYVNDPHLSRHN